MSIRIESRSDGRGTVIYVSGDLKGGGVGELERMCRETTGPLALDLSGIRLAAPEGVGLLGELDARGVRLRGQTPYLQFLLESRHG